MRGALGEAIVRLVCLCGVSRGWTAQKKKGREAGREEGGRGTRNVRPDKGA
jgi:hypothetical protein